MSADLLEKKFSQHDPEKITQQYESRELVRHYMIDHWQETVIELEAKLGFNNTIALDGDVQREPKTAEEKLLQHDKPKVLRLREDRYQRAGQLLGGLD